MTGNKNEERKKEVLESIYKIIQENGEYETIFQLLAVYSDLKEKNEFLVKMLVEEKMIKKLPLTEIPREMIA